MRFTPCRWPAWLSHGAAAGVILDDTGLREPFHTPLYALNTCTHPDLPSPIPCALQGGEEQGGMRIYVPSKMRSAKDMPSHTKLKFRCATQGRETERPVPCCAWALLCCC